MPPSRRPSVPSPGPPRRLPGDTRGRSLSGGFYRISDRLRGPIADPTSAVRRLNVLNDLANGHVQCLGEIVQPLEQQATPPFFHANEQRSVDIRRQSECFLRQSALQTEVSNAAPHPLAGGRPGLGALRIVLAGSSGHRKELRRADALSL